MRGALIYATSKILERNVKVTRYHWSHQDLVEGHQLQLTNNADQSRTFAFIGMHEMKLYILEGTVPQGSPRARAVSAVDGVGRQGRQRDSVSDDLRESVLWIEGNAAAVACRWRSRRGAGGRGQGGRRGWGRRRRRQRSVGRVLFGPATHAGSVGQVLAGPLCSVPWAGPLGPATRKEDIVKTRSAAPVRSRSWELTS